tara:strand:- start:1388 stop:3628 length:2241 start_codon:yes stop_codon:yes gene_type:complete
MIPTNSSGTTNGCDNISSNCVIWQGPDITCIDLCNGDSISEVVAKLATKVCDLITNGVSANPDLTGLNISCLNIAGKDPTELVPVLQAMVNEICTNSGGTNSSGGGALSRSAVTSDLPIMTLPACMQYNDANGNPVVELRLDLFAELIAQQVCTNLSSINLINSTLTSYSSRLDILEACVLPCSGAVAEVQIIPTCVSTVGVLTNVSVVVLALESAFCTLRDAVGTSALINNAINQSTITGSSLSLSNSAVSYGSIGGWQNPAPTLAQSVQNAWLVIDDMYTAIQSIQINCCPGGCDQVVFASTHASQFDVSTGLIDGINFNFTTSTIPATFNDCSGSSVITLTDVNGLSLAQTVSVSSLQDIPAGFAFQTGALVTTQDLTVSIDYCVTDGTDTCNTVLGSTVTGYVPCPGNVAISAVTSDGFTVNFTQQLGINAIYVVDVLDVSGTTVVATFTVNSPSPNPSVTFVGLIPDTSYNVRITTTFQGGVQVCPLTPIATLTGSAPCSQGMDVSFVLDYTGSMSGIIEGVKSGVSNLVSTISTLSGANDYRLSLVTADEYYTTGGGAPTYASCVDYTGLPSAQKITNVGTSNVSQYITAWEMFQNNNAATFTTQLNKLNGGVDGTCVQLGNGAGIPEPTDYAAQLVTTSDFTGAFRSSIAKYVIILTDKLPGGTGDSFNNTVWAGIQDMITFANLNGIKYFVCGPGTNFTGGSVTPLYPWRELATQTGGGWNVSADPTTISSEIIAGCS